MTRRRRAALLGAAAALTGLLAGCAATTAGAGNTTSATTARPVAAAPVATQAPATTPVSTPVSTATPSPRPRPNACAHNTAAELVRVSLAKQHLWMCSGKHLAYSTPVTSGIVGQYTSTPTGDYVVQGLDRNTVLTLITGAQYHVKYWIPFDGPLFGFHDSSWQDFPYGSPKYRTQGSHGCVHMPLKAIAFLYRWAEVGTKVKIRA